MRRLALCALVGVVACGGREAPTGVVVRQVLRGDAAEEVPAAPAASNTRPADVPQSVGTTLVFDQPQAVYRQAQEQARRTFDGDNLRRQLNQLADSID